MHAKVCVNILSLSLCVCVCVGVRARAHAHSVESMGVMGEFVIV